MPLKDRGRFRLPWDPMGTTLRIVGIYLIFGGLWILFSDRLLEALVRDPRVIVQVSLLKGWLYVLVTGLLLMRLIHDSVSQIHNLNSQLSEQNVELRATNQEIRALYEEVAASEEALQKSFDELQAYRERLEHSDERYRLIMAASREGFWDYRIPEEKLVISDSFGRLIGTVDCREEDLAAEILQRIHPEDRPGLRLLLGQEPFPESGLAEVTLRIRHLNGTYRWIQFQGLAVRDTAGGLARIIGAVSDIHDKVLQQERIEYYAFHDPTTGFYNRDYMLELLGKARTQDKARCLLVAGIQGVGRLISVYGTNISEIIHYQIGMRILEAAEQPHAIAMLGTGRFGILIDQEDEQAIQALIDAIEALARVPVQINQLSVTVQLAYGATRCPAGAWDSERLMQEAETAFNQAASEHLRSRAVWFQAAQQSQRIFLGKVEFLLREALDNGEFSLVFQPQVTGGAEPRTVAYEALLRWHSPELDRVAPDVFIPVAESSGQISGIGEFVMRETCGFLRRLMDRTGQQLRIAINASLMELMEPQYVTRLNGIVADAGLRPENHCIEITESALAKYLDSVIENLTALRALGYEIHLDDFGTGYSSLNHLGRLPVHALKIDKTFVQQMEGDSRMKQMTELIIQVGHQLDMRIIAEGVETEAQFRMLEAMGCDSYQGYYFSRPLAAELLLEPQEQGL